MRIELAFIAHNRIEYTKYALLSLRAGKPVDVRLPLWDNAFTNDTRDSLESIEDERMVNRAFSRDDVRVNGAAHACFSKSNADSIGITETILYAMKTATKRDASTPLSRRYSLEEKLGSWWAIAGPCRKEIR